MDATQNIVEVEDLCFIALLDEWSGQLARIYSLLILRFLAKSRVRGLPAHNPCFSLRYPHGEMVFSNQEEDFLRNACGIEIEE